MFHRVFISRLAKNPKLALLFFSFLAISGFRSNSPADRLVGIWESEEKNLRIEIYKEDEYFVGKTVWLLCSLGETAICTHLDTENPDPALTGNHLIGLKVVKRLSYEGEDTWGAGKIYDPSTGHTYDAQVRLVGSNTVVVRGYWKLKWFGRSMVFNRWNGLQSRLH